MERGLRKPCQPIGQAFFEEFTVEGEGANYEKGLHHDILQERKSDIYNVSTYNTLFGAGGWVGVLPKG